MVASLLWWPLDGYNKVGRQVGHPGSVELFRSEKKHYSSMAGEPEAPSTEQQTSGKKGKVRLISRRHPVLFLMWSLCCPCCSAAPQGEAMGPRWHQALGDSQVFPGRQSYRPAGGEFLCCSIPKVPRSVAAVNALQVSRHRVRYSARIEQPSEPTLPVNFGLPWLQPHNAGPACLLQPLCTMGSPGGVDL